MLWMVWERIVEKQKEPPEEPFCFFSNILEIIRQLSAKAGTYLQVCFFSTGLWKIVLKDEEAKSYCFGKYSK